MRRFESGVLFAFTKLLFLVFAFHEHNVKINDNVHVCFDWR